ncbi:hypothetical protein D3C85_938120 [compost metagenome]
MALTTQEKIAFIKLRIGDVTTNPIYPMFSEEDYAMVLGTVGGDVDKATRIMAISATMTIGSIATREVIGDLTIENTFAPNYLKAMDYLINDPVARIPSNLMPWVAGLESKSTKLEQAADLTCNGQCNAYKFGSTCTCGC